MTKLGPQMKNVLLTLMMFISLNACKKDALKVDTEKRYVGETSAPPTDLAGGAMSLVLKPGGVADINPGGDIVYRGSYDISGKKITVKIPDLEMKFRFTIITDQELEAESGEKLRLKQ